MLLVLHETAHILMNCAEVFSTRIQITVTRRKPKCHVF